MPRPRRQRRVCDLPKRTLYGPLKGSIDESKLIILNIDEFETIRLIDHEGLNQEECAERMDVARTTVQGIYISARKKIAQSLVEGLLIKIEGGDYLLCKDQVNGKRCGGCRRGRMGI